MVSTVVPSSPSIATRHIKALRGISRTNSATYVKLYSTHVIQSECPLLVALVIVSAYVVIAVDSISLTILDQRPVETAATSEPKTLVRICQKSIYNIVVLVCSANVSFQTLLLVEQL